MRKIYFYSLITFIIMGCDNKEEVLEKKSTAKQTQTYIINGDIEYISDITDGTQSTKPKFIYEIPDIKNKNIDGKILDESTLINFNYGAHDPTKSGCQIRKYNGYEYYYTDAGVYGYNPYRQIDGYLVRGQGQPHHNFYYNSLVMMTSNRGKQSISRGQIINSNASRGSAISIEYPFKANTSYEITLFTYFNDDVYAVDKVNSNGFPTVSVQLKDSPILLDNTDACGIENMIRITELNPNYIKSYVLENHIKESKTLKFNFSPTETKRALQITINPAYAPEEGVNAKIPTNSHTMALYWVKITTKPFDPSIIVPIPPGRR